MNEGKTDSISEGLDIFVKKYGIDFCIKRDGIAMNIMVLINLSWGEIEWILPVCRYIKKNHSDVHIDILFNALSHTDIIKDNDMIYKLLSENVDNCYDYKDFLPFPFRNLCMFFKNKYFTRLMKLIAVRSAVKNINPDIFLKDISPDLFTRGYLVDLILKKGCRQISFPHSSLINKIPIIHDVRTELNADVILCNTKECEKIFPDKNKDYDNETCVVGIPKYDKWWISYQQEFYKKNSPTNLFKDSDTTVFLFLTRSPHSGYLFDKHTADEMMKEVLDTVLSFDKSFIIIKPHPRQNLDELKEMLNQYDSSRWVIDQAQAMYLSLHSDIVISMGASSVILDILATDNFVIEYYKHSDCIKYFNGYGKLGLVASANNVMELEHLINDSINNRNEIKKPYVKRYREIIPKTEDEFTKRAVTAILNEGE